MEGAMFVEKLWKLWSDDFSINLNLGESKATFGLRWLGQDDCYFVLTAGAGTFSGLSFPRLPGDLSDHVAVGGAVKLIEVGSVTGAATQSMNCACSPA